MYWQILYVYVSEHDSFALFTQRAMKKHGITRKYIVKLVNMRTPIKYTVKEPTEKVSGFFEYNIKSNSIFVTEIFCNSFYSHRTDPKLLNTVV